MWTLKNQILLAGLAITVAAIVFYQKINVDSKTSLHDKMLQSVSAHNHENALIYADQLLQIDPSNRKAKQILTNSGQIFYYLQAAKSTLTNFIVNNEPPTDPKQLYKQFNKARVYVAKAVAIDPHSLSTTHFEETLDKDQTTLIHLISIDIFNSAQRVIDTAGSSYRKTQKILNTAETSQYLATFLPYQSAWASVDSSHQKVREKTLPELDEMIATGQLMSEYKQGKSRNYTKLLVTYIDQVQKTVDTLIATKGSYDDFSKSAKSATTMYEKLQSKLVKQIPDATTKSGTFSKLLTALPKYQIAQNSKIANIINANETLYTL
ncbi:MAG TPA: hypothetical protein ENJ32_12125 [Crenotrichaceae bacterium]|nr:hypothetical protein [Crenotrichaceae bacterium]